MWDLPLVGDEFAGYRLLAVLGRGGMSTVYRAENPRLGNVIALKVMAAELAGDDVFRARFLEESRIAAGLDHPNVVPVHDSGSCDGLLYIAMRYVAGTDLRQMLEKQRQLPAETGVSLLAQAARALDTAHRRALVHRDVKPGNLLIEQTSDDTDPDHVYLTDFGITPQVAGHTGLTATGQFTGTVDYIAPEQIRGLPVLGPADQYSLGCVLYECLTGQVPFERDMTAAIIWAHVEEQPTRPTLLRPDLPHAVDEVLARVLAKEPGDRYGNCREFMAAARAALGPLADPPGTGGHAPGGHASGGHAPGGHASGGARRAGVRPFPAGPQPQRSHPGEIAHEPASGHGAAAETALGLADWARSDQEDPPGPGAPGLGPATVLSGAGSPPPAEPPRVFDPGRPRRRGPSRTAMAVFAVAVLVLAAVVGTAVSKVTGDGPRNVALSGNGTAASPSASASSGPSASASSGPSASASASSRPSASASASSRPSASVSASSRPSASVSPSASASTNMGVLAGAGDSGPATLAGILQAADNSVEGRGLLPPASCGQYQQNPAGQIVCTGPVAGVKEIFYQNYSSLKALYGAYEAEVSGLDGGTFRQNTGTCGDSAVSYAEFGWNQEEGHPHNFSVAQMASGRVGALFASGRMACFVTHTKQGVSQDIVWTIDNGPALGVAIGSGSPRAVYQLWASLHHAVLFRETEFCGTAERMNMHDIPTGNLKVIPVCPAGVAALPASS